METLSKEIPTIYGTIVLVVALSITVAIMVHARNRYVQALDYFDQVVMEDIYAQG